MVTRWRRRLRLAFGKARILVHFELDAFGAFIFILTAASFLDDGGRVRRPTRNSVLRDGVCGWNLESVRLWRYRTR